MAKREKLITFEKGMTAAPYSDISPDGELELLNNMEVHAGSVKPAAFIGNTDEGERLEYDFSKEGFTLRYIHATGSIKHLILSKGENDGDVYYYDVKGKVGPTRIDGCVWTESTEACAIGNIIVLKSDKADDSYLLWRNSQYQYTSGLVKDGDKAIDYVADDSVKDICLNFGIFSDSTQFVNLGNADINSGGEYTDNDVNWMDNSETIIQCSPKMDNPSTAEDGSAVKNNAGNFTSLMNELVINKCAKHNQFVMPFFVRYVVKNVGGIPIKVSPPVLVTPTTCCPLLVVDFHHNNDEWKTPKYYEHKFHYGVVGACGDPNNSNEDLSRSNLKITVVGNRDMVIGGRVGSIEVYVTPPLYLFDFLKGYTLTNVPYSFDYQTEALHSWRNGSTDNIIRAPWIERGVRNDVVSGSLTSLFETNGDSLVFDAAAGKHFSHKMVIDQKLEWLLKLNELMLDAKHRDSESAPYNYEKWPFDMTRDFLVTPSAKDNLDDVLEAALIDGNFKLFKTFNIGENDKLSVVEGHIKNANSYQGIAQNQGVPMPSLDFDTNSVTMGGHLFRYNSRLFKYGHTTQGGGAPYTGDELTQTTGALVECNVKMPQRSAWGHTGDNPISDNDGDYPLFIIPDEDNDDIFYVDSNRIGIDRWHTSEMRGSLYGYVYYKDSQGKSYCDKIGENTYGKNPQIYGLCGTKMPFMFFSYPKHGCYRAVLFQEDTTGHWRKFTIPMKSAKLNANFSYWSWYNMKVDKEEDLGYTRPGKNMVFETSSPMQQDLNKIDYSDTYNPYDSGFPDDQKEIVIGDGEILALSVQRDAISIGQFGDRPIVAFCTDGNYALSLDDKGKILRAEPMEGPVLVNRNSLVSTTSGIYYMSKDGLCLLRGNQHKILSRPLEGKAPSNIVVRGKEKDNIVVQQIPVSNTNASIVHRTLTGDELAAFAQEHEITLENATAADIFKCIPGFVPSCVRIKVTSNLNEFLNINPDEHETGAWIDNSNGEQRPFVSVVGVEKTGSPLFFDAPDYVDAEYNAEHSETGGVPTRLVGKMSPEVRLCVGQTEHHQGWMDDEFVIDNLTGENAEFLLGCSFEENSNAAPQWASYATVGDAPLRLRWREGDGEDDGEKERTFEVNVLVQGKHQHGQREVYHDIALQTCRVTLRKSETSSMGDIVSVETTTKTEKSIWEKPWDKATCSLMKGYQYELSCNICDFIKSTETGTTIRIYSSLQSEPLYSGPISRLNTKAKDFAPIRFTATETDPVVKFWYVIDGTGIVFTNYNKLDVVFTIKAVIGTYRQESRFGLVQSRDEAKGTQTLFFDPSEQPQSGFRRIEVRGTTATGPVGLTYTMKFDGEAKFDENDIILDDDEAVGVVRHGYDILKRHLHGSTRYVVIEGSYGNQIDPAAETYMTDEEIQELISGGDLTVHTIANAEDDSFVVKTDDAGFDNWDFRKIVRPGKDPVYVVEPGTVRFATIVFIDTDNVLLKRGPLMVPCNLRYDSESGYTNTWGFGTHVDEGEEVEKGLLDEEGRWYGNNPRKITLTAEEAFVTNMRCVDISQRGLGNNSPARLNLPNLTELLAGTQQIIVTADQEVKYQGDVATFVNGIKDGNGVYVEEPGCDIGANAEDIILQIPADANGNIDNVKDTSLELSVVVTSENEPKIEADVPFLPNPRWNMKDTGLAIEKNKHFDLTVNSVLTDGTPVPVAVMVGGNLVALYDGGYVEMKDLVAQASFKNVVVTIHPLEVAYGNKYMTDEERQKTVVKMTEIPEDYRCAVSLTTYNSVWEETSYMRILSNPNVKTVYDEVGQRIFYGVEGARTFVVFNMTTETFSMMTTDYPLRAVLNQHPFSYIQFEDYSIMRLDGRMDYIDEKDGAYEGYLVSRPIKMDSLDLKKISEISLVGNYREEQELTIQGSNSIQGDYADWQDQQNNWVTLGTTKRNRVPHIVGRWFKYWRVVMKTKLHETENITGIRVKFEVRGDGRMR